MKKLLMTGSSGLVGHAVEKILKENNAYEIYPLSSKDCDLRNYEETLNIFLKIKPNYVFHLAGTVGGLFKNINNKVKMFEDNILINFNIVKICHIIQVEKLICCLSTCIFPDNLTYPIDEKMLHLGPPHPSNDSYAYAKRMLEVHCKTYRDEYRDNFISVIPTNIYGPHDNFNLNDCHIIPALIHKCYLAKMNNTIFKVLGTGKPLRQFIYSEDLAKLLIWVLENYDSSEPIILSVDEKEEVSIEYIAKLICKEFQYNEDMIEFDNNFSDGQYKKTANSQKLNQLYKYNFISIDEGIRITINWFIQNYNQIRK